MTRTLYLKVLEETIDPLKTHELKTQFDAEGNLLLDENLLHFQQDGAPPHYFLPDWQMGGD